MRKFNVVVNGENFDVTVDEMGGAPVAAPVAAAAPSAPAPTVSAGAHEVDSPMPGTILKVNVKVGDMVKAGQAVVILEAMKMENDIVAPVDGKVVALYVKEGDSVESNSKIASIE